MRVVLRLSEVLYMAADVDVVDVISLYEESGGRGRSCEVLRGRGVVGGSVINPTRWSVE